MGLCPPFRILGSTSEVTNGLGIAKVVANDCWKRSTKRKVQQGESVTALALLRGNRALPLSSKNDKFAGGDVLVFAGKYDDLRGLPS